MVIKTSIYRKQYKIEVSHVDFNKQIRLSSLFSLFQDVASEAVEVLGAGINALLDKYSVSWVLIKMRVEVIRYPLWNEDIIVETWPQEAKSLEFERDFNVYDKDNNIIIKAMSTWVIVDINTRRIKRSSYINLVYPEINPRRAINKEFLKLKPFNHLEEVYKKMIGYSDIDINGHLNNSKYIDYITDCFTFENHQMYHLISIEVNFINEALPGEVLILSKDLSCLHENIIYIEGNKGNNIETNQTVFKAILEIARR